MLLDSAVSNQRELFLQLPNGMIRILIYTNFVYSKLVTLNSKLTHHHPRFCHLSQARAS